MIHSLKRLFLLVVTTFIGNNVAAQEYPGIKLSYVGSSTVGNFIGDANDKLEQYQFTINTSPESSGGESAILEGRCDIAGIARAPGINLLNKGVSSTLIGWDAIAIIINATNPIQNLTKSQLRDIYTGRLNNWKQLGGKDQKIIPYIVGEESATRKVCRSIVLGNEDYIKCVEIRPDNDIISRVENDPGGIGHISYSFLNEDSVAKIIDINGQSLSLTNSNYPLTRPLYLLWWPGRRDIVNFIDWVKSSDGQRTVMKRFIGAREGNIQLASEIGKLIVYTETDVVEDGGIFYYPHRDYEVLNLDHSVLTKVNNHDSPNDEDPKAVDLKTGDYLVRIPDDNNENKEFLVHIEPGKITRFFPKTSYMDNQEMSDLSGSFVNEKIKTEALQFFGDFRFRLERDHREDFNRFRTRLRLRAGLLANISSIAKLGLRLASSSDPNDPNSTHVDLSEGFNQIRIAIDRAYFHLNLRKEVGFNLWLGKFANPFQSSSVYSELVWDADIQPEGFAFDLQLFPEGKLSGMEIVNGSYLISQLRTDDQEYWLNSTQLNLNVKINTKTTIRGSSGLYYFNGIKDLAVDNAIIDFNDGNQVYDKLLITEKDTVLQKTYLSNFHILDNFITIGLNKFSIPVELKFQYIKNLGAEDKNSGYAAGISLGQLKRKNQWMFYYQYHHIEQDAVFTPYAQDDLPNKSNANGHVIGVSHNLHQKISIDLWGLADRFIEDSGVLDTRVRLDMNVKF